MQDTNKYKVYKAITAVGKWLLLSLIHICYKDEITGKRNSVYAADLASLREMEKKINKDMEDLLITCLLYTSRCV